MRTGLMRQGEFLHDLLVGADALRDFFIRAILPPLAVGILTGIATVLLYVQIGYAAILLPLLFFIRLIIAWHVKTENEEARRAEDGAYRSALLDASAGADELACAGAAPARERLFLPARDLVKKDEYAHLRETQTDALQSVFDAAVFILLLAALIPSIPAGTLTGIGLAVWFLVLQSLLAEYRTLPDAVRQAQQSAAAALRLLAPVEYEPSAAQAAQDDNMMQNGTEEPSAAHALLTVRSLLAWRLQDFRKEASSSHNPSAKISVVSVHAQTKPPSSAPSKSPSSSPLWRQWRAASIPPSAKTDPFFPAGSAHAC